MLPMFWFYKSFFLSESSGRSSEPQAKKIVPTVPMTSKVQIILKVNVSNGLGPAIKWALIVISFLNTGTRVSVGDGVAVGGIIVLVIVGEAVGTMVAAILGVGDL
jgi:hypothetical protein